MKDRSDDPDVSPESAAGGEIWGTREDLLLASAVSRHGTTSWDSVAMEVQSRSPSAAAAARFTPASCRLRFISIQQRFTPTRADENDEDGGGEVVATDADSCVEELRKLRVAELRREVEQRDLLIGSLQLKLKRLKEERERSLSGETKPAAKEEEGQERCRENANGAGRVSRGQSGSSCNSSDLKRPGHNTGVAEDVDAVVKEASAAHEMAVKEEEASGESVGSKEAEKESSDVQSSASPSRRRRRPRKAVSEEAEEEAPSTSASVRLAPAEAQPLLAFLESLRTSKSGSLFQRRLERQEGGKYRGTIRRHVDLETIRSKLEPGAAVFYTSATEFYRDLLLLCANALVFFPRGSPEHAAATRTRAIVSASLRRKDGGVGSAGKGAANAAGAVTGGSSAVGAKKPKAVKEVGSLLEKAAPIIVCRKRSSITKAAAAAAKEEVIAKTEVKTEKVEAAEKEEEQEAKVDKKKRGAKDKTKGLRSNKTRGPVRNAATNPKTRKAVESAASAEKKSDKRGSGGSKAAAGGVIKKQNAVDFLNRIKQNSVPSTSTERVSLLETLKLSAATEQKKSGKGDSRKEPVSSSSGSKKAAPDDTSSRGRRSVGRPPKRAAAPPSPPPAKRVKDDKPSRKRGKK